MEGAAQAVVCPVVLSASRATDVPAFYGDWFMNRLRAGYFRWQNPFRPSQVQTVSAQRVRAIVFWTKNPAPMLKHLDELERRGFHCVFHCTLNDYEREGFEPGLPPLAERIDDFRRLSDRLGPERVTWRMDPLLLAKGLDVPELLARAERLYGRLGSHARQMVFSFADMENYAAVRRRLARTGWAPREFSAGEMESFGRGLAQINRVHGMELATCAEAVDLSAWGIARGSCVDAGRLARLWPEDAELAAHANACRGRKDKGQRRNCGCTPSKDVGRYRTCPHACAYCYANASSELALRNWRAHRPENESI